MNAHEQNAHVAGPLDRPRSWRPEDLGTILSVWAHPDDETYLAGGIMAAARDNGQRVVCVTATAGELGTSDPVTWPPDRLGRLRRWEAAAAMAVLGVDDHRVLGLPDGGLEHHDAPGTEWVGALLDEVRPDTILTFGPDGITGHADHVAVHRWVHRAWQQRGCPGRLMNAATTVDELARFGAMYEEWNMYMTDARPEGVPIHDLAISMAVSGAALDRKFAALRAMASQTGDVIAHVDPDVYEAMISQESFVEVGAQILVDAGTRGAVVAARADVGAESVVAGSSQMG